MSNEKKNFHVTDVFKSLHEGGVNLPNDESGNRLKDVGNRFVAFLESLSEREQKAFWSLNLAGVANMYVFGDIRKELDLAMAVSFGLLTEPEIPTPTIQGV